MGPVKDDPIAKRFNAERFDPDSAASWRPLRIVMDARPPLYPDESSMVTAPVWLDADDGGVELRHRYPGVWRWLALLVVLWGAGLLWVSVAHGGFVDGLRSIGRGYGNGYFIFLGFLTLVLLVGVVRWRSRPMRFTPDGRVLTGGSWQPEGGFDFERDGVGVLIVPMRFVRERVTFFLVSPRRCAMFLVGKVRFDIGGTPVVEYKVIATIAVLRDELKIEKAIRSMPQALRRRLPMYLTLQEVDFSRAPNVDRAVRVG